MDLWLPLTQDTRQQGLSNASVTAVGSGATINANGKLGKCYYLDGTSNGYISTDFPTDVGTDDFTISLWVKIPTISSGTYFTIVSSKQSPAISVGVGLYWNYSQKKFLWSTADGTNATEIWTADTLDSIVYDKWIHLVMVRDNNDAKKGYFYINGTRYELASVPVIRNITTATNLWIGKLNSGQYPLKMYISDLRFWKDRALAPREIELLSRGLVAHYPLNGGGRGGDNMCTWGYTRNPLFSGNSGATKLSDTDYTDYRRYTCTTAGTSGGRYGYPVGNSGNLVQGNVYTWSAEFRSNRVISFTSGSYIGIEGGGMLAGSDIKIGTTWTRLSKTWTQTTSQAFILYPKDSVSVNDWIDIRNLKIETGDKLTPYIPSSNETAYTTMGYNSTTEYDVSGYQNNMTKTGTITYTSDSARYSVASHFINGSYLMGTKNVTEYLPTDSLTVNLWVKPTTWGTPISCTEGGGWNFEAYNSILQFQCYISGVGYKGSASTVAPSAMTDGKWHMLTGVFDRAAQQTRFYIDGELKGSNATGSTNGVGYASNRLIISGEAQSTTPTSSSFVGEESDVRIYATALSADQIKELYNTAVSVANNGTLMGYELVEG